jgi:hypothetical protein
MRSSSAEARRPRRGSAWAAVINLRGLAMQAEQFAFRLLARQAEFGARGHAPAPRCGGRRPAGGRTAAGRDSISRLPLSRSGPSSTRLPPMPTVSSGRFRCAAALSPVAASARAARAANSGRAASLRLQGSGNGGGGCRQELARRRHRRPMSADQGRRAGRGRVPARRGPRPAFALGAALLAPQATAVVARATSPARASLATTLSIRVKRSAQLPMARVCSCWRRSSWKARRSSARRPFCRA